MPMFHSVMTCVPKWVACMIVAPLLFLGSGCHKPEEDLGLELLPGDELGGIVDTAAMRAYSFADSAVQTSGLTRNVVGSYVDPDFGLVHTSIVTQVRLITNNVGQNQDNSGLQADSIVLALAFEVPNSSYGNLNAQQFQVYELAEGLSVDTVYHSDDVPVVAPQDLVFPHAGSITPAPLVQPVIAEDTLVPQLRIRLSNALAERFLDAFGTPDLADNTAFLSFFKGLHITVDNGVQTPYQGGVLHINTTSTASKLTVYYKNLLNEPDLARTFDMAINSNCVRYSVAVHDRSQALTATLVQALADTSAPAPAIYLQTLGGLRTALRFPDLADSGGEGQALAKAELVLPILGTYYPYYAPPTQLFLFRQSATGTDVFLPDQRDGISGIGGLFVAADQEYRFNITRYVQGVINGDIPSNGVDLVAGSAGVSANRAILCGPDHPDHPMRLELTFTTY